MSKNKYSTKEVYRRRLARRLNDRMRALEKAERDFWGYNTLYKYAHDRYGRKRFSERKQWRGNEKALSAEIKQLEKLLTLKTTTVRGSKQVEAQILESFKNNGIEITDSKEFFRFLDSDTYQRVANKGISSSYVQEFFTQAFNAGENYDTILSDLDDFKKGEIKSVPELFKKRGLDFLK